MADVILNLVNHSNFEKLVSMSLKELFQKVEDGSLRDYRPELDNRFHREFDVDLEGDIMEWLEKMAPYHGKDGVDGPEYLHHRTGEDNGDAHLKRQLLGQQVTMPVQNGRLHLGTWEQIHYAEFDGQRPKRILVKVIGIQQE